jgi:hypothetical protein
MESFKKFRDEVVQVSIKDHMSLKAIPNLSAEIRDNVIHDSRSKLLLIAKSLVSDAILSDVRNQEIILKSLNQMKDDLQKIIDGFEKNLERSHLGNYHHLFGTINPRRTIVLKDIPTNFESNYMFFDSGSFLKEINFRIEMVEYVIDNVEVDQQTPINQSEQANNDTAQPNIEDTRQKVINYLSPLKKNQKEECQ